MHQIITGSIHPGQVVGFTCGVRSCVNPDHLYLRTATEKLRQSAAWRYKSKRTHCRHGHPYSPENTEITKTGARRCRTCHRATNSRSIERLRRVSDDLLSELKLNQELSPGPRRYYVYHLIDPATGEVFYVGKGSGPRAGRHRKDALAKARLNPEKEARIRAILAQGLEIKITIVQTALSEERALLLERSEIARIGLENLTNKVSGVLSDSVRSILRAKAGKL